MAPPAPPPWSYLWGGTPFTGSYVQPQTSPFNGSQVATTVPMTPQGTPGAVNPYAFYGGFWPGISYMHDGSGMPSMPYAAYPSPSALMVSRQGNDDIETPTRRNEPKCEPECSGSRPDA
jgi:hypothetical protein